MRQTFPDITGILVAKQERRLALAALSWEEKVVIIEQMQQLLPRGQWKGGVIREQAIAYEFEAPEVPAAEEQPLAGSLPRPLIQLQGPPASQTIIEERR